MYLTCELHCQINNLGCKKLITFLGLDIKSLNVKANTLVGACNSKTNTMIAKLILFRLLLQWT